MTKEEFLKALPAYMGCKIKTPKGEIATIDEVTRDGVITCYKLVFSQWNYDVVKLILRSVDQITPSEKEELARKMEITSMDIDHFFKSYGTDYITFQKASKATRWLNEKGFDTDGLIESGFAVKEEQL